MTIENSPLVDIGLNLTDRRFDADRHAVIERALDAGVTQMVLTGTSVAETEAALELCASAPEHLFATAGVHPHYASDFTPETSRTLAGLVKESGIRALGETGLDFNRNFSTPADQERAFTAQLELACEHQLPLFIHERDAASRMAEILRHYRDHLPRAVIHCFTGDRQALFSYLDLDLHIGITGWVCDERRGTHLPPLLGNIPDNRLMLESDAPYLLPRSLPQKPKSRRNEPCYLRHLCDQVARFTGIPTEELARQTTRTAQAFFDLPSS